MDTSNAAYWIGQDGNIWLKDASGTRNVGPATGSTGLTDTGFYDPWASEGESPLLINATRIDDPMVQKTTDTSGTGLSASDAAAYDLGISNLQAGLGRLDPQKATGLQNINQSLDSSLQQLLQGRNQAESTMGQTKTRAGQDYLIGKNTINAYAGAGLQGLRRLMGSRGAGGGSAYTQAAPGAVAREATMQRNDLGRTYGQNMQDVDTGWNNYLQGYNESVNDVNTQGQTQRNALEESYKTNKASISQQIAQLIAQKTGSVAGAQPYLDQANQLLGQTGITPNPTIQYNTQAYQAPNLGSYTASRTTPTLQGQQQGNDFTSPYLQALLGKKKTNI
jgi:hypothetical protein